MTKTDPATLKYIRKNGELWTKYQQLCRQAVAAWARYEAGDKAASDEYVEIDRARNAAYLAWFGLKWFSTTA